MGNTEHIAHIAHEAKDRVLDAAEHLFAEKGYASITLRDIAAEVGIRHASLYHHFPGGKQELFGQVTERNLLRHRAGLEAAIREAEPEIRSRLRAVAAWLLSQPPMDLLRMTYSDMPAIDQAQAERLSQVAFESLLLPVAALLARAHQEGEIENKNPVVVAGGLLGMVESLHAIPDANVPGSRIDLANQLIDVMIDGLRPR